MEKMQITFRVISALVVSNFRSSARSLFVVSITVWFGVTTVLAFAGYNNYLFDTLEKGFKQKYMLGDVVISSAKNTGGQMTVPLTGQIASQLESYLKNDADVDRYASFLSLSGMLDSTEDQVPFWVLSYDPVAAVNMRGAEWFVDVVAGRSLPEKAAGGIILGQALGRKAGCLPAEERSGDSPLGFLSSFRNIKCKSDNVTLRVSDSYGRIVAKSFKIIGLTHGVMPDVDNILVLADRKNMEIFSEPGDISYFSLFLKSPDLLAEFIGRTKLSPAIASAELNVTSWKNTVYGRVYTSIVSNINVYTYFVGLILSCLSFSALLLAVRVFYLRKVEEIKVLRFLGFSRVVVNLAYTLQGSFLGLVGFLLGGIVLILAKVGLRYFPVMHTVGGLGLPIPLDMLFTWPMLIAAFTIALLLPATAMYLTVSKSKI